MASGRPSNAAIIRSTGNKIADLTMDVAVNEPCYLTATALGMTEDDSQSAATVSFTDTAGNGPFMFNQGAVTFTGPSDAATLNGQMRRCSIKIMQDTTVLPVVPMFHANAWGLVYAGPICGAKMVFPGPKLDGASIYELLDKEQVTLSAGVPTVWLALLDYCAQNKLKMSSVKRTLIGGSAVPLSMIDTFPLPLFDT